ncbi:MAG TPA: TPM domain-containing protein, partial [bacterium]|nr:TPM domain-containing protein [bacterium]
MTRKLLIILALFILPAAAHASIPRPAGFVNDLAGVVEPQTKANLERFLDSFEKQTGVEVAVATLPSLDSRPVEDVAVELFKSWGIGKKGKDNGILFLVAPNEKRMRIEVGYGLEGAINDALAGRILDNAV